MSDELADRSFLVADDEPFSRDLLRSMLNQLRPRRVITVTNGAEALEALRADSAYYDCVITDFKMEPVNGLELLKTIRIGTTDIRRRCMQLQAQCAYDSQNGGQFRVPLPR